MYEHLHSKCNTDLLGEEWVDVNNDTNKIMKQLEEKSKIQDTPTNEYAPEKQLLAVRVLRAIIGERAPYFG